jgi:hypothetical protein
LTTATEALGNYTGEDVNPPKAKAVQKAMEASACAKEDVEPIINQAFQLYSNLLAKEAQRPWIKVLEEQIDCTLWTELYRVEHVEKHRRSWSLFMDCIIFHLLRTFRSDAAEMQRFYISNRLKKPNRVLIWQSVKRIQQHNGYLDLLCCLYYSDQVTKLTKVVKPLDDVDLASHILRMLPRLWQWQDQCELMGATVPQSMQKLLEALECIKNAFPTDKECDRSHGNVKGGTSKKKMVSFSNCIPKK